MKNTFRVLQTHTLLLTSISSNIYNATPTSLNSKHKFTRLLSLVSSTSKFFARPDSIRDPQIAWASKYLFRPNWHLNDSEQFMGKKTTFTCWESERVQNNGVSQRLKLSCDVTLDNHYWTVQCDTETYLHCGASKENEFRKRSSISEAKMRKRKN